MRPIRSGGRDAICSLSPDCTPAGRMMRGAPLRVWTGAPISCLTPYACMIMGLIRYLAGEDHDLESSLHVAVVGGNPFAIAHKETWCEFTRTVTDLLRACQDVNGQRIAVVLGCMTPHSLT